MSLTKLRQLAAQIATEDDPTEMARLIAELTELLREQQSALDEQIKHAKRAQKL